MEAHVRYFAVALLVLISGCVFPPNYENKVEVQKTNGVTSSVVVHLMGQQTYLPSKRHVEAFIKSLETLTADLKTVSDQMEIIEPAPKTGK